MNTAEIEEELAPFFPECKITSDYDESDVIVLIEPDEAKRTQAPVGRFNSAALLSVGYVFDPLRLKSCEVYYTLLEKSETQERLTLKVRTQRGQASTDSRP